MALSFANSRSGAGRHAALALLSIASLAGVSDAQLSARWSDDRPSPFTIVLDSADLAAGRGRSLVAFLAGRVTGLFVTANEFPGTQPPLVMSSTTAGSFARPEPRLYIDGVHMWDDPAWDNAGDGSAFWAGQRPPSLGWAIPVDEIAEVRIVLGPAGAGEVRYGGSRGAVLVTTLKGSKERSRAWASSQLVSAQPSTLLRANHGPTGTWTPMAIVDPDLPVWGVRVAAGASGRLRGNWTYRLSANDDAGQGVLSGNRAHRTDLSTSLAYVRDSLIEFTLDVRYGRIAWKRAGWNEVFNDAWTATWGAVPSDSLTQLLLAHRASTLDLALDRRTDRYTAVGRLALHATPATRVEFAVDADLLDRSSYADHLGETRCNFAPPGCEAFRPALHTSEDEGSVKGSRLAASLRQRLPSVGALRAEARVSAWRGWTDLSTETWTHEIPLEDPETDSYPGYYRSGIYLSDRGHEFATRVAIGSRGVITGTVRRGASRFHFADGAWDLWRANAAGTRFGFDRVQAVAAYGESDDVRSIFPVQPFTLSPDFPRDRTVERRFGLTAYRASRLELAIDRSITTVGNGAFWRHPFSVWNGGGALRSVSWRVEATQLRIGATSAPGAPRSWHWRLGIVDRVARFTDFPDTVTQSDLLEGNFRRLEVGGTLSNIWSRGYRWADGDGDGVITPAEVTPDVDPSPAGSTEPRWIMNLVARVEATPRLAVEAVLESRLGQVIFDRTSYLQCRYDGCAPLHDPDAPLHAQAAAISASAHGLSRGFIRDADFVRAREVSLEYRFGDASRWRDLRLRLTGHNLLTITPYPGDDVEGVFHSGALAEGFTFPGHRRMRGFSLRVEWMR